MYFRCFTSFLNFLFIYRILEADGLNSSEQVNKKVLEWQEEKMQSPQFLAFRLSMIEENIETKNYQNFDEKIQEAKQVRFFI